MNVTETLTMYQSINSQNITANEELIVNLFEAIDSSDFKLANSSLNCITV
jgi:hypothetical protein